VSGGLKDVFLIRAGMGFRAQPVLHLMARLAAPLFVKAISDACDLFVRRFAY
jgi:hypothetical protein